MTNKKNRLTSLKKYDRFAQGLYHPEEILPFPGVESFPAFDLNPENHFSVINAWWLANASHLSYLSKNEIKETLNSLGFVFVEFIQVENTFCYIAHNNKLAMLIFRGTQFKSKIDAKTDINFPFANYSNENDKIKVHRGFLNAINLVWGAIDNKLTIIHNKKLPLWISGHSLGAALAILCAARLKNTNKFEPQAYTFGAPKVGNAHFKLLCEKLKIFRTVNCCDIVSHLPPRAMGFSHIGNEYFFCADNNLHINPKKMTALVLEWKAAIAYACSFPLFRKNQISFRALADHSIINYSTCLWNRYFKDNVK